MLKDITKKEFSSFVFWAFLIGFIFQGIASVEALNGNAILFKLINIGTMYAPLLAVLIVRKNLKGIGWRIQFKGKMKYILSAWFLPTIFMIIGAALFYGIFREAFDTTGKYLVETAGQETLDALEMSGLTIPTYAAVSIAQCFLFVPLLNGLATIGEEVGWRGMMYVYLKEKFGVNKGRIIGGAIWGVWHWPLIIIAGYEYNTEYIGKPVLGPLLFIVVCVVFGIILDYWYSKTESIIVPALAHGAINGSATVAFVFFNTDCWKYAILGPSAVGAVALIPMLVFAIIICMKEKAK